MHWHTCTNADSNYSQDEGTSGHNLVYADLGPAPMKKKHIVPIRDTRDDQVEYAQLNYHAKNREVQVAKNDKHSAGMFCSIPQIFA